MLSFLLKFNFAPLCEIVLSVDKIFLAVQWLNLLSLQVVLACFKDPSSLKKLVLVSTVVGSEVKMAPFLYISQVGNMSTWLGDACAHRKTY